MKATRLFELTAVILIAACGGAGDHRDQNAQPTPPKTLQPRLPTGNYLDPAGTSMQLGSFPVNAAISPEGDRVVVLLNGWREQGIQVVDRSNGSIVQTVTLPSVFIGLDFSPDGKSLWVSGGNQDVLYRFAWNNKTATLQDSVILAPKPDSVDGTHYPAGLSVSRDGRRIYAAENLADSVAIIDIATRSVKHVAVGRYPYGVAEDASGNVLVTLWGEDDVVIVDPLAAKQVARVKVARHPSAITTNHAGTIAYIASATTNQVVAFDTRTRAVAGVYRQNAPGIDEGGSPNGFALSPDESRLYVAEADNNALAVWDVKTAHLVGRIPVEWYPTSVIATSDSVLVINGKGKGTGPNPDLPSPGMRRKASVEQTRRSYALGQLNGSLTTLTRRDFTAIDAMSKRVAAANGWNMKLNRSAAFYPPFQHVIYVIKENRTYDQILGDLRQADGDTSLLYFGRESTPNHHALAERFGIYDRFFVNAEVSAEGHNWSTAAIATDYVEKTVPSVYANRGRDYDYEGSNRGAPADGDLDVASPVNGYLWDLARRAHVTLRNYGEFAEPEREASGVAYRARKKWLDANTDNDFPSFDMQIPDQTRIDAWLVEFNQYVRNNNLPQLEIMRLPNDHTSGGRAGLPTPRAYMADNDLAVGRIVEAVSKSPYWKNTVIFVLEDDAQDGPDHVDSHRSPLLVISAYSKTGRIDRFANTTDVIATMTEILKMGSLSQFDYFGRPLRDVFNKTPDLRPYTALTPAQSLTEKNPLAGHSAIESRKLKLAKEDQSDDDTFNRILWRMMKGEKPYPGRTRMPGAP